MNIELKKKIIGIVAFPDGDDIIGRADGTIPWKSKPDLKFFRETTTGHKIVMGRKTWDSLKGGILPDRKHYVVSRQPRPEGLPDEVVWTVDYEAIVHEHQLSEDDRTLFVIGGAEIYLLFKPFLTDFYISIIQDPPPILPKEGDVLFPFESLEGLTMCLEERHISDSKTILSVIKLTKTK